MKKVRTKELKCSLVITVALIGLITVLGITVVNFNSNASAQGSQGLQRFCPPSHQCSCIHGIFSDYDPQTGKVFTLNNGCIE